MPVNMTLILALIALFVLLTLGPRLISFCTTVHSGISTAKPTDPAPRWE